MKLKASLKIVIGIIVVALVGVAVWYLNTDEVEAATQSTDDAYVKADSTVISPRINGTIVSVSAVENKLVHVGDTLVALDERDLRVALEAAKAQVDNASAKLAADTANLKLAVINQKRYANLAADGSGSTQARDQADAQLQVLQADLARDKAVLAQAKAALAAAELNLSYARITAPVEGITAQNAARVGAYVNAGKPLLSIVPLDAVYIEANFRETQLAQVRPGQPVVIHVDAMPGVRLQGHVESLGPASGVSFSPVAPHNATGNFTKIVQRLPIRIRVDAQQPAAASLRVGMSVKPEIDVRSKPVTE